MKSHKKRLAVCFAAVAVLLTVACGKSPLDETVLRQTYPSYYGLGTGKGLEVYVWETDDHTYRCGVLSGTNRSKTDEELSGLKANGTTVDEMKAILSSYGLSEENIAVLPLDIQTGSYTETDLQEIRALFDH